MECENNIGQSTAQLAEEADRRLAEWSIRDESRTTNETVERCITDRNRRQSQPSYGENQSLNNKYLSVADELSQLSEGDATPMDQDAGLSDGMAYDTEGDFDEIDLDASTIHEDSLNTESSVSKEQELSATPINPRSPGISSSTPYSDSQEDLQGVKRSSDAFHQAGSRTLTTLPLWPADECAVDLKSISDQMSAREVDSGAGEDLESPTSKIDIHGLDLTDMGAMQYRSPTPFSMNGTALEESELGEFVRLSVHKVGVIRCDKNDKHAASKVKDIQQLVEKALTDAVSGEHRSLGDLLDGSAWRG